ncbi:hypothetical protein C8F04DRAFT_1207948 [Mycena alexandri]|uniref:Uncharacterized protein n=1 Tax=Mycena alexandri TaxID=1745969 RepID=A0AAD6T9P8_9AGAR|nr:hypothetical protein C8F04DRAFT_1207948 [Mycena alexandri]
MLFTRALPAIIGLCGFASAESSPKLPSPPVDSFYTKEIDVVAQLKSRLTGSTNHTNFVDYLERELESLGLQSVPPSAYVPYSGDTGASGVSGSLVQIAAAVSPDWAPANGKIAVVNITNTPTNGTAVFPVWPGSQQWGAIPGIPATNAGVTNLTAAAAAGVKGVIYNWHNISSLNALGQYGPFKINYQGVPALYVTNQALENAQATLTSTGTLIHNRRTRTLYVVVEGTHYKNESVIISTHTDGTNAVEENGHIALLAKARELAASRPKRTTVLVFLTGHLHTSGFTGTGRVFERWFQDHPELWAGNTSTALKAVFGSCVEHLGAEHWREDPVNNVYYPTGDLEPEWLFAATSQLAALLGKVWNGAQPGVLRAIDPNKSLIEQSGEGLPLLWNNIPEISLCTGPDWLLKIWPGDFDELQLADVPAVKRQTESFLKIWQTIDGWSADDFGIVDYARIPAGL